MKEDEQEHHSAGTPQIKALLDGWGGGDSLENATRIFFITF